MALAKDLKDDIISINENTREKRTREHIHEQLFDFIRFTNLKQFVFFFLFNSSESKTAFS